MHRVLLNPAPDDMARENDYLRQQLKELAAEARRTEATFRRSHQRELALLTAEDLPQLLQLLTEGMRRSFQLPCVSLVLEDPDHELRHLLHSAGVPPYCYDNVLFCDRLHDISPIYQPQQGHYLGPPVARDHRRLFPLCQRIRSVAILPLRQRGTLIGSLNLGSSDPGRFTAQLATDALEHLAAVAAVCLENTANREHLVISGLTDALTGLHNRRYLERRLGEEVARARRYGHPLSCLFIDADHFKRVNDLYGHGIGDLVLREISLRVKACLRASDVATRFGGEEFALLLPQTDAREAHHLAERIRSQVAARPVDAGDGAEIEVSVSIGVSELGSATSEEPGRQLLDAADQALYQAKKRGRNRVCGPSAATAPTKA